jgi:hypothetical protein
MLEMEDFLININSLNNTFLIKVFHCLIIKVKHEVS